MYKIMILINPNTYLSQLIFNNYFLKYFLVTSPNEPKDRFFPDYNNYFTDSRYTDREDINTEFQIQTINVESEENLPERNKETMGKWPFQVDRWI